MTPAQLKANDIATSDGASLWLSSLPLKHERFSSTTPEFFDEFLLRYWWKHKHFSQKCVQKAKYNMDHALTCKTGRFASRRQNEIVNDTADVLSMVYKGVRKEPTLSTAPNSNDKFQTEISVCSFWQRLQRLLVGVTISYPFAPSYRNQSLAITIKTIKN